MARCSGTVTKNGTTINFHYEEDQANNNRFIKIICNPQRMECLYCHAAEQGPMDICEKNYHRNPSAFYKEVAQLIADDYNAVTNTWPVSVDYWGITYRIATDYPRPFTP